MPTKTESTTLVITRVFDAPPAHVFEAWLDQEQWQAWIGPEGIDCDVTLLERRVGGRYRLLMHLPDGKTLPVAGIFKAIEPHVRFAFTWGREGEARDSLVTVTLRDLGGKTELTLRQEGLPTAASRDSHAEGWSSALNELAGYLAVA